MKTRSIVILILLNVQIVSFSQGITDSITNALARLRDNQPSDQLFLHLDRNLYCPGDTIRFQAYVRDRTTGIFGSESVSLYALLLNQYHQTVDSARFRISHSTSSGWLTIPFKIPSGTYSVLAFTSMMMNYKADFVFSIPVKIMEADTTETASHIPPINPYYPPVSSVKTDTTSAGIDLRFLPEGGTFIYGLPQRVAFNAVTSAGERIKVAGEILNQRNEKITTFRSEQYGPGVVEFTPEKGDTYYASLEGKSFTGMRWPLPVPDSSGITLSVINNDNGSVNIIVKGNRVEGKSYLLSFTMNNALVLSREFRVDTLFHLTVDTKLLPAGTAYVTVYDSELNPVAERLVFVNNDKKMNISISTSFVENNPDDETELTINTTDGQGKNTSSVVSVAVVDSASGFCNYLPFADIESTFLYDNHFYDNLPSSIKLQGLSNIDKQSVDLLFMVYGWRKFSLKQYSPGKNDRKLFDYDYFKISNLQTFRGKKHELQIMTLEDANVLNLPVDKNKEIVVQLGLLNDSIRQFMIISDSKSLKYLHSAKVEFAQNRTFSDKAKGEYSYLCYHGNITPAHDLNNSFSANTITPDMLELYTALSDSVINIDGVTIRAKRAPVKPPVFINKYEKPYQNASLKTLTGKDITSKPSLEEILECLYPISLDKENKKIYLRPGLGKDPRTSGPVSALFVLDDIPYGNSYEQIEMLMPSQIASVTALKGLQGFTRYGYDALGGVVFITTKNFQEESLYKNNDNLMRPVRLFRTDTEFYIPKKETTDILSDSLNSTLLWMNEVYIDGTGPVKIRFPKSRTNGTSMVFVNGVSFTNRIGSECYKVNVNNCVPQPKGSN
ncbi:MAG TPA: hypothetical protein PKM69_05785 [Bacteroidales bacterium]|nr:hypothetical protein [Bacteroidales bacterium]